MLAIKKKLIMSSVDEYDGGYLNWNRILGDSLGIIYQKLNVYVLWSRNSVTRNISFRNTQMHTNLCTRMFVIMLFVVVKKNPANQLCVLC